MSDVRDSDSDMKHAGWARSKGRELVAALALVVVAASFAWAQVDQARADAYFQEAARLCQREGGRIWGVSLCGPMVIADPVTQTIATSQPAPPGARPRALGFANAPVEWGGMRWSAYIWPDVSAVNDPRRRGALFLHELFHRVQPQLGLMVDAPGENDHLDQLEGRYWLQLEWRALRRALQSSGAARAAAASDALAFRARRRAIFTGTADQERADEIREGLAQYTGVVGVSDSPAAAVAFAIASLAAAEEQPTFTRTFAYTSGVGY